MPAQVVYEDDEVIAFLDIGPVNLGHTLVVPKEHCKNLLEASEEVLTKVMSVAQKIGLALIQALDAEGFNLGVNNGRAAGQKVDHLHLHIIPRFSGDGMRGWGQRKEYKEGEFEEYGEKIRKAIKL
jgi:histidine triad (HIT) family protein